MAAATTSRLARPAVLAGPRLHRDPVWLRRTLIGLALAFLALFLLLPLAAVFTEALRRGLGAYFALQEAIASWRPEAAAVFRTPLSSERIFMLLHDMA